MNASDSTEDPLLALHEGRLEPFERFVRARATALCAYFRRRGARADVAEDLCQEVFMRLCRAAVRYEPRERFDAYVARVMTHVWIDHCRRTGIAQRVAAADMRALDVPDETAPIDAALEHGDEVRRLRHALEGLGETHRETLELALLHELAYAEIAQLLDIPVGTVKSRVFHALSKLRAALDPQREESR